MCTGLELAALAASAAGTGLSIDAQNDAAKDQARAAGDAARRAGEFNRKAGARVSEEVQKLKTNNSVGDETAATNDYVAALRRAQLTGEGGGDRPVGNVSDQYVTDAAASGKANVAGNFDAARSLARVDAPFMQRVREGASSSRTQSDLSRIAQEAQGQNFLDQLRQSLIHPNAGQMAAGSFLTAAGGAMGSRAKKPASPKPRPQILTPGGGFGGGLD